MKLNPGSALIATYFAAATFTTVGPLAAQSLDCKTADEKLAGGYELRGVREVGSILVLAPDGRFGYSLTVGANDEEAIGCWQRDGRNVILEVSEMRVNDGDRKFKRMILKIKYGGGLLRTEQGKTWGLTSESRSSSHSPDIP